MGTISKMNKDDFLPTVFIAVDLNECVNECVCA